MARNRDEPWRQGAGGGRGGTPPVGVSRQVILFGSEEVLRNRIYWKNNQLLEPFFPLFGAKQCTL